MSGTDERRRVRPEEINNRLSGTWWALRQGWALGEGFHGAPLVLVGSPVGAKSQEVRSVRLDDLRFVERRLRRRRNFRRVLGVAGLVVLAGLLALARRR